MARTNVPQGNTINYIVTLPEVVSTYDNVIIEFYTDPQNRVKFSYIEKDNYRKAEDGSTTSKIVCRLLSKETAKFLNDLFVEVKLITDLDDEQTEEVYPSIVTDTNLTIVKVANKNDY